MRHGKRTEIVTEESFISLDPFVQFKTVKETIEFTIEYTIQYIVSWVPIFIKCAYSCTLIIFQAIFPDMWWEFSSLPYIVMC